MSILPAYINIDHNSIIMTNNNLIKFPDYIFEMPNILDITSIIMTNNYITEIPTKIKLFKNLKVLDLSNNDIDKLPEEIYNMPELTDLNVSINYILFISAKIVLNKKLHVTFHFNPIHKFLCSTLQLYQDKIINNVDKEYEQIYLTILNIIDEYQQKILSGEMTYFKTNIYHGREFFVTKINNLMFNVSIEELKHIACIEQLESNNYIDQCKEIINIYYPADIKIAIK